MKAFVLVSSPVLRGKIFKTRSTSSAVPTTLPFEEVYQVHAAFAWRVLRGMGVPDALIEDAVQDVFIVVHARLSEFDGRHSIKTWLFAIAYRVACNYRRKYRHMWRQEPLHDRLTDPAPTPAEVAERAEALSLLGTLLDRFSDDKRAILILAEVEGMSAPEIAEVTRTPLNTVYTRLRRARVTLSDALSKWRKEGR
jgi:RNA polymerase sigma-70 factor (ECF subfamily)